MRKTKNHGFRLLSLSALSLWPHVQLSSGENVITHWLYSGALGSTALDYSLFLFHFLPISIPISLQLFSWACCHHTQYIWTFLKLLLQSMDKLQKMQPHGHVSKAIVCLTQGEFPLLHRNSLSSATVCSCLYHLQKTKIPQTKQVSLGEIFNNLHSLFIIISSWVLTILNFR